MAHAAAEAHRLCLFLLLCGLKFNALVLDLLVIGSDLLLNDLDLLLRQVHLLIQRSDCDAADALTGISAVMSETTKISASSTQITDRTTLRFVFMRFLLRLSGNCEWP